MPDQQPYIAKRPLHNPLNGGGELGLRLKSDRLPRLVPKVHILLRKILHERLRLVGDPDSLLFCRQQGDIRQQLPHTHRDRHHMHIGRSRAVFAQHLLNTRVLISWGIYHIQVDVLAQILQNLLGWCRKRIDAVTCQVDLPGVLLFQRRQNQVCGNQHHRQSTPKKAPAKIRAPRARAPLCPIFFAHIRRCLHIRKDCAVNI